MESTTKPEDVNVDYDVSEEDTPHTENSASSSDKKAITLCVSGFRRPFAVEAVRSLVSEASKPINLEEHFYMNGIQSLCYVSYPSMEEAKLSKDFLQGKVFPEGTNNHLSVRITSISAESMNKDHPTRMNNRKREKDESKKDIEDGKTKEPKIRVSLDDLYRKTSAQPSIYYIPLNEKQREERLMKKSHNLFLC